MARRIHMAAGMALFVILCLAVIGIYAGKGPVWALSADWLSAGTAAAGLAQMNAISNLAGFGTTYIVGYIKQATGSYPLAILPLACLSGVGALAVLWIARGGQSPKAVRSGEVKLVG